MKDNELGKEYADGEAVCKEGDRGDVMYVIQSGKVKIARATPSGERTIATLDKGEIFGEMALFDRMPRSATARASGSARVLSVDRKKLFSSIDRDPTLVFRVLESMSKRIRALNDQMAELSRDGSRLLQACANVEDTCASVLEEARNIVKSENGSIMLLEEDDKTLSIKAAFGHDASPKVRFSVGEGIAGDVMRSGRAEMVNDLAMDVRYKKGGMEIKSMLCVPLKAGEEVFGVMNFSCVSDTIFTLDDLKLMHSLGMYASIAIENARSFCRLKDTTAAIIKRATLLDL